MTPAQDLDVYEVAFLAGGRRRLVETALAALVASGRVAVLADGALRSVVAIRSDPVEAAVLDAVGGRGRRSVETVHWRLADDVRISAVGARLAAAGLLREAVLRPGRRLVPTAAGRRAVDRLRRDGAAGRTDPSDPLRVAVDGPAAVPDPALRDALHRRRRPPAPPHPLLVFADGVPAARRTRDTLLAAAHRLGS